MRIAFLGSVPAATVFPDSSLRQSGRGGHHPAPWIAALLPDLARLADFQFRVFMPQRAVRARMLIEKDGVEYEGLPVHMTERWNPQTNYWVRSIAVHRALKEYRPDVIHAFGFETGNVTVALRTGLPVSAFIQGIVEELYPWIGYLGEQRRRCDLRIERAAVRKVRWFVAETRFAERWALSHRPDAHVARIPHPLRRGFLEAGSSQGGKRIISVGGLDPRKGMDTLIRALARMGDREATLRLIGDGSDRAALQALAGELGVAGRVELPGSMPSERVVDELRDAAVFVIASRMDTSPNVISEAHAMGLPVVGTNVGGIPEMIEEGVDGHVVDRDDAGAFAARLDALLANPAAIRRMGEAGRRKVAVENDPDRVARAHVEFFRKIREDLRAG